MNINFHFFQCRWLKISGLLLTLAVLIWYGYRCNPEINLGMCLREPAKFDGRDVSLGTEAKVIRLLPDGFILQEMGYTIPVKGSTGEVFEGDYVRLKAVFHKEGYLEIKDLYVARGRRIKIIISVAPVLLVFFFFFRKYRFDWCQILFRERI